MSYADPTLVELYAELHLLSGTLKPSAFFGTVPFLQEHGFGDVEMAEGGLFRLDPSDKSLQPATHPRVRCWNEERTALVQIGEDLLVANIVGDYPGWNPFLEHLTVARDALRSGLGEDPSIASLSLNYIDRFYVPTEGYTLGKYLACDGTFVPSWYADATETLDITLGRGLLKKEGFNRQVRVKVRFREEEDDIQVEFRTNLHDSLDGNDVDSVLERLHSESNEIFEALITDTTREQVMGGSS